MAGTALWRSLLESYTASLPDFVKLAESYGAAGLRATKPDDVDGVIKEMLSNDRFTICDIAVDQEENCFPMIPSGAPHNEMILGPEDEKERETSVEGMVLV